MPVSDTYAAYSPTIDTTNRLEAAALRFHARNPHVLHELIQVCLRVKRLGRRCWAIRAAYEVVRYNALITTDHRTYKLNNNHAAFYARWMMRDIPELAGFLKIRHAARVAQEYDE